MVRKKRSYITSIFGIRISRADLHRFLWSFLVCLVAVAGLLGYAFTRARPQVESTNDGDSGQFESTQQAPQSLREKIEFVRTATGLGNAEGIILRGTRLEEGREYDMQLSVKAPHFIKKSLSDGTVKISTLFDGETFRFEFEDRGLGELDSTLEEEVFRQALILEGGVLAFAANSSEYREEAPQVFEGNEYWTLLSCTDSGGCLTHLIDPQTGYERVRYLSFRLDGQTHQFALHFSDFRPVDDGMMPHAYRLFLDNALRGVITLDSIEINPGLAPWLFSP